MTTLSLKIVLDEGAVTRTIKFEPSTKVAHAFAIIKDKVLTIGDEHEYGLFLPSTDDTRAGTWLEPQHALEYYMLHDGDTLLLLHKLRNLRVRMLDGAVKTLQVDESKTVGDLMHVICGKIGITNHDEYGLCPMETEADEAKENKPQSGTLTMKRKPPRERDAKMDQLSKKLKTDDNVDWLDQHRTLREIGVDYNETLLLKRRLFYSDRNVDSRDPKQLNMLYNENKSAILNGKHPVTTDQAVTFAAIQCQVNLGDFHEEKHKPGIIEDLREYLPEQCANSRGVESRILKQYRKYQGLSQLEAMHLYNKTARELPTYGVTFFLVKEKQKGKNKLISCLLGINANAILRLDIDTKEILQEWPLTHVKSYHASKNETFMLDFGDYSDKPYTVKTNDALRIRDILEGYIDVIRKKMLGGRSGHHAESGAVAQESVTPSRGNMITHVSSGPSKIVEHSYVGPSRIIPFEQGSEVQQGTQMMTVQQVIVTNKGSSQQKTIVGEIPMRSDMSKEVVKKLNHLNSNAVSIVTLLSDPTEGNVKKVKFLMETIQEEVSTIREGVEDAVQQQESEEAKRKLKAELEELMKLCGDMAQESTRDDMDQAKIDSYAKRMADLTTQIVFSVDPGTRRRSRILRRSRQSFMQDERVEATLRRASFLAAAQGAALAADSAHDLLHKVHEGARLSDGDVDRLEATAIDNMGKLNAAVALLLNAHSDPKNVDYAAAVNSMNTIKELLPKLAEDAKALSESVEGNDRQEIIKDMEDLCEAAKKICSLTGCDDHAKLQQTATDYGDVSGRLVYVIGCRNPRVNADKENEIVELSRQAGDAATQLLVAANGLTELAAAALEPGAQALDNAGVCCANAMRDLITCAQLTAPTIHEAHCRSALSAAVESVSTQTQALALAWQPLVLREDRRHIGEDLTKRTMLLAEALDRLRASYENLDVPDVNIDAGDPTERARLRFVAGAAAAKSNILSSQKLLDEPIEAMVLSEQKIDEIQNSVSQKMGQVNAAIAALLHDKSDPNNLDYNTAELAISTITELMPDIIKDVKCLISSCSEGAARDAMLRDMSAWCDGVAAVCAGASSDNPKELDNAANEYAKASKKLSFVFSPRARKAREQLMMELFDSAHVQAMGVVDDTNKMADTLGGANGTKLRDLGNAVHDSAHSLRTTLMVTAPTLEDSRCRSELSAQSSELTSAVGRLAEAAGSLQDDETGCRVLSARLHQQRALLTTHAEELAQALDTIRATLDDSTPVSVHEVEESPAHAGRRLQFIAGAALAGHRAQGDAERLLGQPALKTELSEQETRDLESKLSREIAASNSAVATLIQSKTDRRHPDYEAAEMALKLVADVLPDIIQDSQQLVAISGADAASRAERARELRAWCGAVRAVCACAGHTRVADFVESAQHFADTSNKLSFVFNAREMLAKEQKVLQLSSAACDIAREMADDSQSAARRVRGTEGAALTLKGRQLRNAAQVLYTTAQLTAPSIEEPRSISLLVSGADVLETSGSELVAAAAYPQLRCGDLSAHEHLGNHNQQLKSTLQDLRSTCEEKAEEPEKLAQRSKYISGVTNAQDGLKMARKLLEQPAQTMKLNGQQESETQKRFSKQMAQVNAAVASLITAKADVNNPDYVAAEHSARTIADLIPGIVKDAKALSSGKDEKTKLKTLENARDWCDGLQSVLVAARQEDAKELDKAAQKYINASNRLQFTFGPHKNPIKEQEIVSECGAACDLALRLCSDAAPASLRHAAELASKARALHSTALLTAPSIDEASSVRALVGSADALSSSAEALVSEAANSRNPGHRLLAEQLRGNQQKLDGKLHDLKETCTSRRVSMASLKAQQLKFVTSAAAAQNKAKEVTMMLDQPVAETNRSEQENKHSQEKLVGAMAEINSALASLINAKSDPQCPDYETADKSLERITQLMPEIVKETRELSKSCKDEARQALLEEMRAWCEAIQAVCASAHCDDTEKINNSASKLADATQKLRFVFNSRKNLVREQQIMQLSSSACDKARQMAAETRRVASTMSGAEAALLDQRAVALDDCAAALLTTAQLTAPPVDEAASQRALLASADALSACAHALERAAERGTARSLADDCRRYCSVMDKALDALRTAVTTPDSRRRVGRAPAAAPRPAPAPGRVRVVSHSDTRRASQDLLNHMRKDADQDLESRNSSDVFTQKHVDTLAKIAEQEKKKLEQYRQTLESADDKIQLAEKTLSNLPQVRPNVVHLDAEQKGAIEKQMELKLAVASIAAAKLVASSHPDEVDYTTATQSAETLAGLVPDIVKDAALLSNTQDEKYRSRLLEHIKGLCEATRTLVRDAKGDNQNVNIAAAKFGEKSAGLLYTVSEETDPAQEKGVISRAKEIGESAVRLADRGARLAESAERERATAVCDSGRRAASAAGGFVYTAKLVAPLIHHQQCQNSLITASHELSTELKHFATEWKPFSSDPKLSKSVTEMDAEAGNLEKLLENFRHDLAGGKLVKRKEQLMVVDTPLRQLAVQIMELSQQRAESSNTPDSTKRKFTDYATELRDTISDFDVANSRFYSAPSIDLKKHRDLENAVQNLQITLLQSRPASDNKPQSNIVDLTDFVRNTSSEAERFLSTANRTKVTQDKKTLEAIKDECNQISLDAAKVLNPSDEQYEDFDDLHDTFGQECDERVKKIREYIRTMKESQPKGVLKESSLSLIDSCDVMKFAMKCAQATAQIAALDETLDDLNDLEKQIDDILQPSESDTGKGGDVGVCEGVSGAGSGVRAAAAGAGRGAAPRLPSALLAYIAALRRALPAHDTQRQHRVKEHARKVVGLCKALVAASSARAATWQSLACPEITQITQEILKELDNPPIPSDSTSGKQSAVLSDEDVKKLLTPTEVTIEPDVKVAENKLQQAANKLVSISGTVCVGAEAGAGADSLRRSVPLALNAAANLAVAAKQHPHHNSSQRKRTEEACEEMCWATYELIRSAEALSAASLEAAQAPRRRLRSSEKALLDSVNKLVRSMSRTEGCAGAVCAAAAARELAGRAGRGAAPLSALSYPHTLDALAAQADILHKLSSDKATPRTRLCTELRYAAAAVCNATDCAAHCAYLLSISEQHKDAAKEGLVDVARLRKLSAAIQDCGLNVLRTKHADMAREEAEKASALAEKLSAAAQETAGNAALSSQAACVKEAATKLASATQSTSTDTEKIKKLALSLVDCVGAMNSKLDEPNLVPPIGTLSADAKAMVDEVMEHSNTLVVKTQALIKEVKGAGDDDELMTWVTFNSSRQAVLAAFEGLQQALRRNGLRAGVMESPKEEVEVPEKSYLEQQEGVARLWLTKGREPLKGQEAARVIIDVAKQMAEDMSGSEKEELQNSIRLSEELLEKCTKKLENNNARLLDEELRSLRRAASRGLVSRVLEDFLQAEGPLLDLQSLFDVVPDPVKSKFLLEKKIAELMAALGRSARTARLVARAHPAHSAHSAHPAHPAHSAHSAHAEPLLQHCTQTELLAPKLVKAAQERVARPDDKEAVERYRALLAQYTESLTQLRDLCDRCVDPMDFVQTAGETMARMREESSRDNNPQMCAYTSNAITRLANRVIVVSMSSVVARGDPELRAALAEAQDQLAAAAAAAAAPPPGARASTLPDWKDTTAQILRTTGEVESALGGENIFKKQREPDQPIYTAALLLHEAVREWSARDNEIVAVAKRMAVLMARLADQMHTARRKESVTRKPWVEQPPDPVQDKIIEDRKRDLIATSKSIVTESIEVAALAKKLALECTDVRIRTNLLQVCERIPTISAQLKMLTQVKATSLANHGGEDDREGMTMIVGNAQNLMSSVQEVVKAAASASVKIASQRGLKWVRRNY